MAKRSTIPAKYLLRKPAFKPVMLFIERECKYSPRNEIEKPAETPLQNFSAPRTQMSKITVEKKEIITIKRCLFFIFIQPANL